MHVPPLFCVGAVAAVEEELEFEDELLRLPLPKMTADDEALDAVDEALEDTVVACGAAGKAACTEFPTTD